MAANPTGLTTRAISQAARAKGYSINHDTVARYLRGDHGRPNEETLAGLSATLGVPMRTLRIAANLPAEEIEPYVPPAEAGRLTRRQRRAIDEIIRAMLDQGADGVAASANRRVGSPTGRAQLVAIDSESTPSRPVKNSKSARKVAAMTPEPAVRKQPARRQAARRGTVEDTK